MKNQDGYKVVPFPKIRQPVVDSLAEAKHMSAVHSLLEVDVTKARKRVQEFRNEIGEPCLLLLF